MAAGPVLLQAEDRLFARLYIAHLEGGGRFGTPCVLPQRDPEFHGR